MSTKLVKRDSLGSPEFGEAISKRMKKKWKNPGFKEKRSKAVKKMWENPEYRAKVVQGNKKAWKRAREKYLIGFPRGEKHYNWKGGKSNHPYPLEFNEELKNEIMTRDGFVCALCWSGYPLHVHHINYDKDDLREKNLITLCASCHPTTHYDRDHWESFLSSYLLYGIGLLGSLLTTCP